MGYKSQQPEPQMPVTGFPSHLTLILPTFQNYEIYQGGAESAPPYYFKK